MRRLSRLSVGCVAIAAAGYSGHVPRVDAQSAEQGWAAPRIAWGHPSLEGTWSSDDMRGVPLQRPEQFGERPYLTDEEFAQRERENNAELARLAAGGTAFLSERGVRWEDRSLYDQCITRGVARRAQDRRHRATSACLSRARIWRDPGRGQPGDVYSAPRE